MKKISLSNAQHYKKLWQPVSNLTSFQIEEIAHIETFEKGQHIIRHDEGTETLFILLQGKAKIYLLHEDGKQLIVHFVHKGELIGELSLLGVEERTKDVVAQIDCICLAIPLADYKERLLTDISFLQQLNVYLAKKMLNRTERFGQGLNYPLLNRLAAFILYTENEGLYHEKHTEVAEYLSSSYRHLLHTFEQLREKNIIIKEKRGYRIIDRTELERLAGEIKS